jgi:aryl-alcohol dehydrogenase-like predicted oxidoreductase
MRYRFLGNSGLQVSEICFGVMTFNSDGPSWYTETERC